ncbi:Uncharacterized protein SCF082_LOCUS18783 [Durusdinium trenchii]
MTLASSEIYLDEDEWVRRAMKSPCATNMDETLGHVEDADLGVKESLKMSIFEKVYAHMGNEIPPEQLKNAIVVKTAKFHPVTVILMNVVTLGLFNFFRPKDNETLLVLTENGRVYLLKVERPNAMGIDLQAAFLTFMRLLLIFLLILTGPAFVVMMFGSNAVGGLAFDPHANNILQQELDLDMKVYHKALRSTALLATALTVLVVGVGCWLYTHWPADYATRSRQSFKAETVSSIQYTLSGSKTVRSLKMRLYFGKYPGQAALDSVGLAIGCSAGPVPPAELCGTGAASTGSGGSQSKTQKTQENQSTNFSPGFVWALTIVLFIVTSLDAAFTWWDRVVAISHVATVREFCAESPVDPEEGQKYCSVTECTKWAEAINYDHSFCTGVQWYEVKGTKESEVADGEIMGVCMQYGHTEGSCCGGCLTSVKEIFGDGWYDVFTTIVEIIGDIGTLLFSFIAAKYAMNVSMSSEHVEIQCQRAPTCCGLLSVDPLNDFSTVEPLALDFLAKMFVEAWEGQEDQQMVADPNPDLEGEEKDRGVKAFKEDAGDPSWEEFLKEKAIIEMNLSTMLMTVHVPTKALGLHKNEQVVAAWSEMERMRFSDLGPSVLYGLIVAVVVFIVAPTQKVVVGKHVFVGATKVLEAFVAGLLFTILHIAFRFFVEFRSFMHAVVVTDMRLFYVRQKFRLPGTSILGSDLRVDAFRHDRALIYGKCTTTKLPFYMRVMGYRYMPGMVYMQSKLGVLKLVRENGNAFDVFHVASQLARTSKGDKITLERLRKAGCSEALLKECEMAVEKGLYVKKDKQGNPVKGVWDIHLQPTDVVSRSPDIYLCDEKETMLYHWSGSEAGVLASPYNSTTDVIVTTDRVFLWQRPLYKTFDCKTCLCWGACWCGCLTKCTDSTSLPNTMSFLNYTAMLSFSSESQVDPPLWSNPVHPPVQCPCVDECCAFTTRCVVCDERCGAVDWDKCGCMPKRPNPRSQLYLLWRCRYNAQQPDLTTVLRPYMDLSSNRLKEEEEEGLLGKFMDLMESGGLFERDTPEQESMLDGSEKAPATKLKEVEILRKLMGAAHSDFNDAGHGS